MSKKKEQENEVDKWVREEGREEGFKHTTNE